MACVALLPGLPAIAADYQRTATPSWVEALIFDTSAVPAAGNANNGVQYLLVDRQTRLDQKTKASFQHTISRAFNERGVESIAHIDIEFDPSYQSLALHTLRLIRGGIAQDRLSSAKVTVLQRETDLDLRIYDGSKTVDVILDDVRTGDIVEYSYSLRGRNPVFGERDFGQIEMQWGAPVHRLHRRLSVPVGYEPKFRSYLTTAEPRVSTRDGWVNYTWQAADVVPWAGQSDTPRWYQPYAEIQWSSFADWSEVARWAEPLYALPASRTGALRAEVDRIAAKSQSPGQRLLDVLAFVQSQVRYLGVEIGPGSHAPRPPQQVLEHRYGDCKDKALLTVTLLQSLGVTAEPALVNTRLRHTVDEMLPSPGAFNHVIVRAQVAGRDYWLDPTRAPQAGSLENIAQADFGMALVLDGHSTGLTPIPTADSSQRRR